MSSKKSYAVKDAGVSADSVNEININPTKPHIQGSVISCHHVHYSIQGSKRPCGSSSKEILHDISAIFKPGMNALLGPTGSGKTSLLDVLAGRKDVSGITGQVLIDGKPQPKNFKCMAGYVVQDDVVMGTVTVRENIMFSASLRLPASVTKEEKQLLVENTIKELGLTKCADTKVGTEFVRGVSGGERKRTNIGMELIVSPNILFLDEPTTGLDASTSNSVIRLLHRLSLKGRTIIFSIHQPRYSIFKRFGYITLLSQGCVMYHGQATEALQFFSSTGYQCEEHNNPADFFLDVINGDNPDDPDQDENEQDDEVVPVLPLNASNLMYNGTIVSNITAKYLESHWYMSLDQELSPILNNYQKTLEDGSAVGRERAEYATPLLVQLGVVSRRAVLNVVRNPHTAFLQWAEITMVALICSIIYLDVGTAYPSSLQNRIGAFFFINVELMFANLSVVETFIRERVLFIHENSNGFYRISAYFFAKTVCDMLPMRIVPLLLFAPLTYFLIGLQMDVGKFFFFFLDLCLVQLSAAAFGNLVSASVQTYAVATLFVTLAYVLMMVFGGVLVNLSAMGDWISWLRYLSIMYYGITSMSINELYNLQLCAEITSGNETVTRCDTDYANDYLTSQGIPYGTAWDLWQNQLALALITVGCIALTYIQLRRIKKVR